MQITQTLRGGGAARMARVPLTRPSAVYLAIMTIALAIGGLQMFHVRGGAITDYGADVIGTAWLYAMVRQGKTIFQRGTPWGARTTAVFTFAGCTASEIGQRLAIVPGVFDPLDIVAFAATVTTCAALDRFIAPTPHPGT